MAHNYLFVEVPDDAKRFKKIDKRLYFFTNNFYTSYEQFGDFNTWEEAELACIRKLIEIKTKS